MVEMTAEEQDKVKRMKKKLKIVSETSGAILNAPTFKLWGSKEKKRKSLRKYMQR